MCVYLLFLSLGWVGEFFEVRTQVDRDLTIVSRVDRRLGLIKNWGVTPFPRIQPLCAENSLKQGPRIVRPTLGGLSASQLQRLEKMCQRRPLQGADRPPIGSGSSAIQAKIPVKLTVDYLSAKSIF
jgi:hypothetical protein